MTDDRESAVPNAGDVGGPVSEGLERAAEPNPTPPPVPLLTTAQIRRLGALNGEDTRSAGDAQFLADQRAEYDRRDKRDLVEELLRRDAAALGEGRVLADGRMAGNLLREFVRGILHTADNATLGRIEQSARGGKIQDILEALGADPIDRRQLRLEGSGVGNVLGGEPGVDPATAASAEVGDRIREFRAEHVVKGTQEI